LPESLAEWAHVVEGIVAVIAAVGGGVLAFRWWLCRLVVGAITESVMRLLVPPIRLELAVLKVSTYAPLTTAAEGRNCVAEVLERLQRASRRRPWVPEDDNEWFHRALDGMRPQTERVEELDRDRADNDRRLLGDVCQVLSEQHLVESRALSGRAGYWLASGYSKAVAAWLTGEDPLHHL